MQSIFHSSLNYFVCISHHTFASLNNQIQFPKFVFLFLSFFSLSPHFVLKNFIELMNLQRIIFSFHQSSFFPFDSISIIEIACSLAPFYVTNTPVRAICLLQIDCYYFEPFFHKYFYCCNKFLNLFDKNIKMFFSFHRS